MVSFPNVFPRYLHFEPCSLLLEFKMSCRCFFQITNCCILWYNYFKSRFWVSRYKYCY